jgi:hypothetical protein
MHNFSLCQIEFLRTVDLVILQQEIDLDESLGIWVTHAHCIQVGKLVRLIAVD